MTIANRRTDRQPVGSEGAGFLRETGLPEVLEAVRWHWKTAIFIALCVLAGATFSVERLPSQYDGKAIVAFAPRVDAPNASSDLVRVVVPKYVEFVVARATIDAVATAIGEDPDTLAGAIDAKVGEDTGNLTVTARLRDPVRAARAANAFALRAVEYSTRDKLLEGEFVARALPPTKAAAPPRRLLEAAALVVGLLLGLGLSVLLERGRPRLRSWRDMAKLTGYPVIGRIPPRRVLHARPTEALAEPRVGSAFRTLRANLEPQLNEAEIGVVAVTSPGKGDGKTTICSLLADSLSRLGMQVLLVDADLRRPRIARLPGRGSRPSEISRSMGADGRRVDVPAGLAAILRHQATLTDEIQRGWAETLWMLPTTVDPDAGDLLARGFADVMSEARESFDVVIVDTPPLLGTDDARTIVRMAKGVLLVVSAGAEARPVNEAILAIESLRTPILGIVGNRLKESRSEYYY